jgi:hypothetical protein
MPNEKESIAKAKYLAFHQAVMIVSFANDRFCLTQADDQISAFPLVDGDDGYWDAMLVSAKERLMQVVADVHGEPLTQEFREQMFNDSHEDILAVG